MGAMLRFGIAPVSSRFLGDSAGLPVYLVGMVGMMGIMAIRRLPSAIDSPGNDCFFGLTLRVRRQAFSVRHENSQKKRTWPAADARASDEVSPGDIPIIPTISIKNWQPDRQVYDEPT
jgi:hypothetical protein